LSKPLRPLRPAEPCPTQSPPPRQLMGPRRPPVRPLPKLVFYTVADTVIVTVALLVIHAAHSTSLGLTAGPVAVVFDGIALLATLGYLIMLGLLHARPTGYNPIGHAVSDYAVGPTARLFTTALTTSSAAVLALGFALIEGVGSPPLGTRAVLFLLVIPLARIGMTLFPTTLEGQQLTRTSLTHYAFAIAAFTLTYLAISETTPVLLALNPAPWLNTTLNASAHTVAPSLTLVVITMLRPLRRIFGLFERLFLLTTNIWFVFVALLIFTRTG
jgi:hypothetical protein